MLSRILALACITALLAACAGQPAATPTTRRRPAPRARANEPNGKLPVSEELPSLDRPTSPAYDGDLSIYESPERDERLHIERVMDLLGIGVGNRVADIGAGGGWFSVRAARRVGPTGEVWAVEINPSYVEHIQKRAEREGLSNVRARLASESNPGLALGSIDVVLLLKTYHEMSDPLAVLRELGRAMRRGGRLGIIDRNGSGDDHGLDEAIVTKEVTRMGFTLRERHDWVSPEERVDYFLVFTR